MNMLKKVTLRPVYTHAQDKPGLTLSSSEKLYAANQQWLLSELKNVLDAYADFSKRQAHMRVIASFETDKHHVSILSHFFR
jgi:hypothetical protein